MAHQQKLKQRREETRKRVEKLRSKETKLHVPSISDDELKDAFKQFDDANTKLCYQRCEVCHQVRLDWKLMRVNHGTIGLNCCTKCCTMNWETIQFLQKTLPTWTDPKTKKMQYHVPPELANLREGEKLLIQRLSVYVPVHHLKMGQTACKGHCAAFRQDISSIVNILPRLPEEVNFVQVIKKYKDRKGDIGEKQFVIRKQAVLDALYWLKDHNHLYKNVVIFGGCDQS